MTSPTPIVHDPNFGRRRTSIRARLLFFVVAWTIVLVPFLLWRSSWSGDLSDKELAERLKDERNPHRVQDALMQVRERMSQHDATVARFYPDLLRLAASPAEEIRSTDAWIMGQDTSRPEFRQALLAMLKDASPLVRNNAALSLVRFGDDSGHPQLVAMLQPNPVFAPQSGRVTDLRQTGSPIRQGRAVAKLETAAGTVAILAPIPGRLRAFSVAPDTHVQSGAPVALIDPGPAQVFEALQALAQVGRKEDLPAIEPYKANVYNFPDKVRAQAVETEKAILQRAASTP